MNFEEEKMNIERQRIAKVEEEESEEEESESGEEGEEESECEEEGEEESECGEEGEEESEEEEQDKSREEGEEDIEEEGNEEIEEEGENEEQGDTEEGGLVNEEENDEQEEKEEKKKIEVWKMDKNIVRMDGFYKMELDDRLLKAIEELGWEAPTLIQMKAIPFLLEGKDVMLRARTGSGKTGAFAIPVIQNILRQKMHAKEQAVGALILAPSRELCEQIHRNIKELTSKCSQVVACVNIGTQVEVEAQVPLLLPKPDIVVSTPSRALEHLKMKTLVLKKSLRMLIIDEADLIFSFGFKEETQDILSYLPAVYQSALASATLSNDVQGLKKMVMHNPITLKLSESFMVSKDQCSHYVLAAQESDKAAVLYTILKLKLIKGNVLIFVNTVDKCYKLKLFLEQFGIRACLLNSELPANVRCHTVTQFNKSMYDIIIASDEQTVDTPTEVKDKKKKKQKLKRMKDGESGVARGIDFRSLSVVLNFDFPLDVVSYIHRAGRTARGNQQGSVLSFVSTGERRLMEKVDACLRAAMGVREKVMKTFEFKMEEVEGFRYRSRDAWKAATRVAVREARLLEIKQEIFNSENLKGYFADNPKDFSTLRHDKALHTVRLQPHLKDVPEYLVPEYLQRVVETLPQEKRRKKRRDERLSNTKKQFLKRSSDPLQDFNFGQKHSSKRRRKK